MIHASILFGRDALSSEPPLESLRAPMVYTGQRVKGAVRIHHDEGLSPMFDAVRVLLRGQVNNEIGLGEICWKVGKPLVRMSCVKVIGDFQRIQSNTPHIIYSQSSFFFDIPEFVTLPSSQATDSKEAAEPLPPSIRVVKKPSTEWRLNSAAGVCDVTYHIEACFFKNGRAISDTQREIIMMPVPEMPPPIDPEDLKAEYLLSATSTFESFWKRKSGFVLFGSSTEPHPFVMDVGKRKSRIPGTDLMFNFSTRAILDGKAASGINMPRFTMCEIVVTLEATTYFQERESESVISLAEARKARLVVLKTTKFKPQTMKMRLKNWRKVGQITSGSNRLVEWSVNTLVKALIPCDAPRLPSFFSSLVSRRYAFGVEIRFGTDLGIHKQKPMRLKIPVQMVHAGLEKGWGGQPEAGFEDDIKVPAYVP